MKGKRTWRWWVTRIELTIGIGLVAFMGLLLLVLGDRLSEPCFGCMRHPLWSLPISAEAAVPLAAFGVAVIGLIWMIRTYRGPRDEPPPWRYRDR